MQSRYPEGYLESLKEREAEEATSNKKSKKKKRGLSEDESVFSPKKKKKAYEVPKEAQASIKKDKVNAKLWDECLEYVKEGQQEILKKIEVCFQCICCQELVYKPITTPCLHNICKVCLKRSFSAEVYTCPMCRQDLESAIIEKTNDNLQKVLLCFFPGYEAGR